VEHGSTVVEDKYRNYCLQFAVEEILLEITEANTDESSLGSGKGVKWPWPNSK